jgi:glycerol kinase
MCYKIGDNV